jgi:Ca2+-binding EF-hand superfamily protein
MTADCARPLRYNLLQTAFREFDLDKSGKLSLFELELGIRSFNLPFPHEHILAIAKKYADQDDDGEISYAEFAAALSDAENSHKVGERF